MKKAEDTAVGCATAMDCPTTKEMGLAVLPGQ